MSLSIYQLSVMLSVSATHRVQWVDRCRVDMSRFVWRSSPCQTSTLGNSRLQGAGNLTRSRRNRVCHCRS